MALKPGRVGVHPSQVDLFGNILGGGSGGDSYTKAEADAKFETKDDAANAYVIGDTAETVIANDDYFPFYDTSETAKRKSLWSNIKSVLKSYFDTLYVSVLSKDVWTSSSVVSSGEVSFTGLDDTAPYNTAFEPYFVTFSAVNYYAKLKTVTGSQTSSMSLTYTTDAPNGTLVKLHIIKDR